MESLAIPVLAHRLIVDAAPPAAQGLESHAVIYLFLFDVWTDLFGVSFAQRQTETESQRLMIESFGRPDFREGVTSFLEKRAPRFGRLGGDG